MSGDVCFWFILDEWLSFNSTSICELKETIMITTLAWRNIWRNKKRTVLLISSVMVGIWALLIAMSFVNGLGKNFIDNSINTEISHIQIHHPEYQKDHNALFSVTDEQNLMSLIRESDKVESFTTRTKVEGIAMSSKSSRGIKIVGVEPGNEARVTGITEFITDGGYFKENVKYPVVVGNKLARSLKLKVGSKVVLSFMNAQKEITSGVFRTSGILSTSSSKINEGIAFIQKEDFYNLFNARELVHEVAIKLHDIKDADSIAHGLSSHSPSNKAETWKELAPELEVAIHQTEASKFTILVIIILAFSFGIINTLLMQVSERTRELGMLMANGMNRRKVFLMINSESFFTILVATGAGLLGGFFVVVYFNENGFDFSRYADALENLGWSKVVYPYLLRKDYLLVFGCSLISGIIGASYPAFKAIRLKPVEAMRRRY